MNTDWFSKLKEFDSLGKMKKDHLVAIGNEEKRLKTLEQRRQDNLDLLLKLKNELHETQQNFFELEKKMKTSEEQASRLRDIGGDENKIKSFLDEASKIENYLFELMDKTEQIQTSLNETKTFLSGLEKTLQEITDEVTSSVQTYRHEIAQIEHRSKLIQDELPDDFRTVLERTLKKNLAVGVFTRIENGSCFFCRYKISRLDESEIDMQKQLKTCPQCARIFLPYGS